MTMQLLQMRNWKLAQVIRISCKVLHRYPGTLGSYVSFRHTTHFLTIRGRENFLEPAPSQVIWAHREVLAHEPPLASPASLMQLVPSLIRRFARVLCFFSSRRLHSFTLRHFLSCIITCVFFAIFITTFVRNKFRVK